MMTQLIAREITVSDGESAMNSLRRIVRVIRASNAAAERQHRLTAAQLFVMRQVAEHPGESMGQLSLRTLTTISTVSGVVGRLIDQGLLRRAVALDDRRRAVLTLTAAGKRALAGAGETVQERLVSGFSMLPGRTQTMLARGLESWVAAAGLSGEPVTMFHEPAAEDE